MSVPQLKPTRLTYEEYLRREASSPVKCEYRRGEIFAMAGGTYEHSMIISNLVREIGNALKGKPCRVLESNMKVYVQSRDESTYPDAMIVCGEPEFGSKGKDRTTILNPRVLIEVLSPSTQDYDKEGKFELYAELKSFEEYVVVSSDHARVMTHRRLADGGWRVDRFLGLDAIAKIACVRAKVPLKEVYANVTLPPARKP